MHFIVTSLGYVVAFLAGALVESHFAIVSNLVAKVNDERAAAHDYAAGLHGRFDSLEAALGQIFSKAPVAAVPGGGAAPVAQAKVLPFLVPAATPAPL